MEFVFCGPQTDFERMIGGQFYINAFGKINIGDEERFRTFLEISMPPPRSTVYIDSTGGNVEEAIKIGRIIRDSWFSCSIGRYVINFNEPASPIFPRQLIPGKCISAATLIYLGGRLRYYPDNSVFGVHQFSFKNPSPEHIGRSQQLSAQIASYVSDMGVGPKFLEISSSTAGNEISHLTEDDLKVMKVVTGGVTDAEWTVQAKNGIMYVRGERDSIYGHHKVMLCHTKGREFFFWAVIESQGREYELNNFGLVEIVTYDETNRIDISNRCTRAVNGAYTNIISKLTRDEARTIAFSEGFGIQIRITDEAPMFLGISPISTVGGEDQLQTFFTNLCDR